MSDIITSNSLPLLRTSSGFSISENIRHCPFTVPPNSSNDVLEHNSNKICFHHNAHITLYKENGCVLFWERSTGQRNLQLYRIRECEGFSRHGIGIGNKRI